MKSKKIYVKKIFFYFKMLPKIDGFIRDYDVIKYLVLFGPEKYDAIFDRIRYLIVLKRGISYVDSQ